MKLSVNMLIHGLNQTVSEALTRAEAAGIDINSAYDAIEASAAAATMLNYRRPLYIDEQANTVTFALTGVQEMANSYLEVLALMNSPLGAVMHKTAN